MRLSESRQLHAASAAASTRLAVADANHNLRGLDEGLDSNSSAGSSATADSGAPEIPSRGDPGASFPSGKGGMEAINRYPFPDTVLMKAGFSGFVCVEKGVFAPQFFQDFITCYQLSAAIHQQQEQLHWDTLQLDRPAAASEFVSSCVQFKLAKLKCRGAHDQRASLTLILHRKRDRKPRPFKGLPLNKNSRFP